MLVPKKIYNNDEITGRIYLQLCNLFIEPILDKEKDCFFDYAFCVMHKLNATKYHLLDYIRIEKNEYDRIQKLVNKGKCEMKEQLDLIFEFEAFLYQVKSSLDMLVKLLPPILGKGIVKTQTYGDKGEHLIKGLTQYKNKKGVNVNAVDNLIELIRSDKDSWLQTTIEFRDELNHHKGLKDYGFTLKSLPNGKYAVVKPKFNGFNTVDFMKLIYSNNIEYHQDFIALALAIKLPECFTLIPCDREHARTNLGDQNGYVKWSWGMKHSE
jgi:hypothetical protein